jgi:hypothetical protein
MFCSAPALVARILSSMLIPGAVPLIAEIASLRACLVRVRVKLSRRLAEAEDLSLIAVFVVETLRKLRMLPSKSSLYKVQFCM